MEHSTARQMVDSAARQVVDVVKPRLRGWLHAGTFPVAVAAGIVLVALAGGPRARTACAIYAAAAALLFGVSALYHRGDWSPRVDRLLRRLDHANIFVFIAATYTPLALLLLTGRSRVALLVVIWVAAVTGVLFRLLWLGAPRWLYTVLYVVIGWTALGWMDQFAAAAGRVVLAFIVAGGLAYSAGALVYGLRRPNPSPRWFGFHEIFHACTIAGFAAHYTAIAMISYRG